MMLLRRFAARVIGSGTDPFRSARWKLTLIYTAILTVVVRVDDATPDNSAFTATARVTSDAADHGALDATLGFGRTLRDKGRSGEQCGGYCQ